MSDRNYTSLESRSDLLRILLQRRCPDTNDGKTAGLHIRILRLVKIDPSLLAGIQDGIARWIPMPIVAIKLNDNAQGRDKRINTKLSGDDVLREVVNAQCIKEGVANAFRFRRIPALLIGTHVKKSHPPRGVRSAACHGTVQNSISFCPGGRPTKSFVTYDTGMRFFRAPLPQICMLWRTKEVLSTGQSGLRQRDFTLTPPALSRLAGRSEASPAESRASTLGRTRRTVWKDFSTDEALLFRQPRGTTFTRKAAILLKTVALLRIKNLLAYLASLLRTSLSFRTPSTRFVVTSP